jgi:hypothetical protein
VDEPAHLTAGYLSLVRGDLSINREHPPLMKALAALPLLALRPVLPPPDPDGPPPGSEDFEFDYARRFLYHANAADRLLEAARIPVMLLTAALGALVVVWTREIAGDAAAVAAAALYAFEPNILAHGRLVTTDLGAAAFTLGFLWAARRALRDGSPRRALLAGALLGAALLTKFSALLLLPLGAALAAAERLAGAAEPRSAPSGAPGAPPARRAALLAAAALAAAWIVLEAGYLFDGFPLPRLYLDGLEIARMKNAVHEGPTYLMGAISKDGFWSYYLVALLVKTPIPLLLLAALGTAAAAARAGLHREAVWILLPAAGWIGAMTVLTRAQIGLRYVLPVTPLLCIAGGIGAARLAGLEGFPPRAPAARRAGRIAAAALVVWQAGAALWIHPHHLAYFNEAAGGPARGWRWLVDSNLDWGQDLAGLKAWLAARGDPPVNLFYFGTADPDHYGIRRLPYGAAQPGLFAVSATHLVGVYLPDPDYLAAFRDLTPVARIGWSILVYDLPEVPERLRRPLTRGPAAARSRADRDGGTASGSLRPV